jgi:hypothetical protein
MKRIGFAVVVVALSLLALALVARTAQAQPYPFAGVWRATANLSGVQSQVEMAMFADGRFSQHTTAPGFQFWMRGRYRIPAEAVLRLDIHDYEPKRWCGPLGCTPIRVPDGETHHFQFRSPDELILRNVVGDAQSITYRRVR